MKYLQGLLELFFPQYCALCSTNLHQNESTICVKCLYELPKTNYHKEEDNPLEQIFWGRSPIKYAAAFFHYRKGSGTKNLLHKLKYRSRKDIAFYLGVYYGAQLKKCNKFKTVDIIVPVPLHYKKERKRGYNQSEVFAQGLAESLKVPVKSDILYKIDNSETQTSKGRYERWENIKGHFMLYNSEEIQNKHILLADDVITTGSTIEACAQPLAAIENTTVSVVSLACTSI